MRSHESISHELGSQPTEAEVKAERLRAFLGSVEEDDAELVAYWRSASSAEHAAAMIDLANYAERMAEQTGLHKDTDEMFPNLAAMRGGGSR